jgi:archaellum component FlaC
MGNHLKKYKKDSHIDDLVTLSVNQNKHRVPGSLIGPLFEFMETLKQSEDITIDTTYFKYLYITNSSLANHVIFDEWGGIPHHMYMSFTEYEESDIENKIEKCTFGRGSDHDEYSIITVACFSVGESESIGHSKVVFLDHVKKTYEIYDPNISKDRTIDTFNNCQDNIKLVVEKEFTGYSFIDSVDICPSMGTHVRTRHNKGVCNMLSMAYILLRGYLYEYMTASQVTEYLSIIVRKNYRYHVIERFISYLYDIYIVKYPVHFVTALKYKFDCEIQKELIESIQGKRPQDSVLKIVARLADEDEDKLQAMETHLDETSKELEKNKIMYSGAVKEISLYKKEMNRIKGYEKEFVLLGDTLSKNLDTIDPNFVTFGELELLVDPVFELIDKINKLN